MLEVIIRKVNRLIVSIVYVQLVTVTSFRFAHFVPILRIESVNSLPVRQIEWGVISVFISVFVIVKISTLFGTCINVFLGVPVTQSSRAVGRVSGLRAGIRSLAVMRHVEMKIFEARSFSIIIITARIGLVRLLFITLFTQLLLLTFRCRHFGSMLFSPFCSSVLEPDLKKKNLINYAI